MTNKSKGEYAYTLIDLESAASAEALDALKACLLYTSICLMRNMNWIRLQSKRDVSALPVSITAEPISATF